MEPSALLGDVALEDMVALDATHLFESSTTKIGIRRGTFMRSYMFEFVEQRIELIRPRV